MRQKTSRFLKQVAVATVRVSSKEDLPKLAKAYRALKRNYNRIPRPKRAKMKDDFKKLIQGRGSE